MSVLDKVRHWIDGETSELVLENAARDAAVKPRSAAEAFIVKIAKAVEEVMQNEIVPLPQGTTIIPTEYAIFLSEEDDKDWQGAKRRGLEQGLYHILAERAKEIAGKRKLETKSFAVELRVDGTLEKGDVRVQHSWEEQSSGKTSVLARPKSAPEPNYAPPPPQPARNENLPAPTFTANKPTDFHEPIPVHKITQAGHGAEEPEEMTRVHQRPMQQETALYRLEIWRDGTRQTVLPIFQNDITIGRGSQSKPVDVALTGDPEISRRHLNLKFDGHGNFTLQNEGRNPAMINNRELAVGQSVPVAPGATIVVCSYLLRIQPK